MSKKIILVSRCAWTLYNFRTGLIRALLKQGQVVIGAGAGGDGFEDKIRALGVPFVPLPVDKKGTNLPADIKLFWRLYRWYRQEKPDLVHHFTIKPVIYGSLAAWLAKIPRIINTVTGLGHVFIGETGWLRRLVEWEYRLALSAADFTFFQNQDDRTLFLNRRLISPKKAGMLPGSGVDTEWFFPMALPDKKSAGQEATFLLLSRLLKEKGIYEFVEAARQVKELFPKTRFQLLGRRDERNPSVVPEAHIHHWQSEGLVAWLGEVEDVRHCIAQADVVVLPSYREGLPRSLLEASAMGKPIITTDAVGCRDVIDHQINGLLVPVKDAQRLAQAMIWLIEHPELREKMGRAGRDKVEQEFDEQMVIEKILAVY